MTVTIEYEAEKKLDLPYETIIKEVIPKKEGIQMEGIANLLNRVARVPEDGLRTLFRPADQAAAEASARREDLMEQLRETSRQLGAVRSCFEAETNFDMIDSYIMQLDALEKLYSYLLKQARQEHIAAF